MADNFAQNLKRIGIEASMTLPNQLDFKVQSKSVLIYHIRVSFIKKEITSIQISEASFSIEKIPKFIFTYTIEVKNSQFKINPNNSFLFDLSLLTIVNWNTDIKFRNFITNLIESFRAFIEDVRENYKNYLSDPNGWIEYNYSIKRNSYHACWNIHKDNSCINIDWNEYRERLGDPPSNFAPFKVLVISIDEDQVKVIALNKKKYSENLFGSFSVVKSKSIGFNDILAEIATHFFKVDPRKFIREEHKFNSESMITSGRRPGYNEAIGNSSFI